MSYVPPHRRGKEAGTTPASLADIVEKTGLTDAPLDAGRARGLASVGDNLGGGWPDRRVDGAGAAFGAPRPDARSAQDARSGQDARTRPAAAGEGEWTTQSSNRRPPPGGGRGHGGDGGGRGGGDGGGGHGYGGERGGGDWQHGRGGGRGGGGGGGKPSAPRRFGSVESERTSSGYKWSAGSRDDSADLLAGSACVDPYEGQRMIFRWPPTPSAEPRAVYFQDRRKQYAFACAGAGSELLAHLAIATVPLLETHARLLARAAEEAGVEAERITADGERLYADKPNLKTRGGGTWSDSEYGHVGLQGIYLRLKSVQRFTEAWALFERAASQRGFRHEQLLGQETVRVVSIGGGPGFELLAFDLFFRFLRQSAHARAHAERAAKAKAEAAAATAAAAPPAAGPGKATGGGVGGGSSWADVMEDEDEGTATQQLPRLRLPAGGSKARPPLTAYPWLRAHMPAPGLDDAPTAAAGAGAGEPGAGEPCACALECISLDLQPGWAPYLDGLGEASAGLRAGNVASTYRFVQADLASLLQGGGLRAHVSRALAEAGAARRVDYCIISNVLIYCSDEPTADLLASVLLAEDVTAIFVSERGTEQAMAAMLERRGVRVRRLMAQDVGRDDRQLVFSHLTGTAQGAEGEAWDLGLAFPNVPYEERKEELRREERLRN